MVEISKEKKKDIPGDLLEKLINSENGTSVVQEFESKSNKNESSGVFDLVKKEIMEEITETIECVIAEPKKQVKSSACYII